MNRPLLLCSVLTMLAGVSQAAVINDGIGDFLATYAFAKNGDLDVVQAQVFLNMSTGQFLFTSLENGPISTVGATFVWGIDRGAGTARFGAFASGVLFDSVVVLGTDGTGVVRDLVTNTATNLPNANVTINGNTISAIVPTSLLPTQGRAMSLYTVNLWPRLGAGNNNQISDFAPDNSNALVTVVPEPVSTALTGFGLAALAFWRCRAQRRITAG